MTYIEPGHGRQRARAQLLSQPLHATGMWVTHVGLSTSMWVTPSACAEPQCLLVLSPSAEPQRFAPVLSPSTRSLVPSASAGHWCAARCPTSRALEVPSPQRAQQKQLDRVQACVGTPRDVETPFASRSSLQLLCTPFAGPRPTGFQAQRCGRLVISRQLLLQRPRRLPQCPVLGQARSGGHHGGDLHPSSNPRSRHLPRLPRISRHLPQLPRIRRQAQRRAQIGRGRAEVRGGGGGTHPRAAAIEGEVARSEAEGDVHLGLGPAQG